MPSVSFEIRMSRSTSRQGWALCNVPTLAIGQNQRCFHARTVYAARARPFRAANLQGKVPMHMARAYVGETGRRAEPPAVDPEMPTHPHFASGPA